MDDYIITYFSSEMSKYFLDLSYCFFNIYTPILFKQRIIEMALHYIPFGAHFIGQYSFAC